MARGTRRRGGRAVRKGSPAPACRQPAERALDALGKRTRDSRRERQEDKVVSERGVL
jgi:hypothetical protein